VFRAAAVAIIGYAMVCGLLILAHIGVVRINAFLYYEIGQAHLCSLRSGHKTLHSAVLQYE
jgi:uncharacterized membrane protein (Fun14 family)